jgi:hypothetical protein
MAFVGRSGPVEWIYLDIEASTVAGDVGVEDGADDGRQICGEHGPAQRAEDAGAEPDAAAELDGGAGLFGVVLAQIRGQTLATEPEGAAVLDAVVVLVEDEAERVEVADVLCVLCRKHLWTIFPRLSFPPSLAVVDQRGLVSPLVAAAAAHDV